MVFVTIGRYDNETVINSDAKAILTGPDTLSNYELTSDTAARRGITLNGTYSGTGLLAEVFIDPDLPEGTGAGQLEESANIHTRADVINSAEVFDIGVVATSTVNGITTTDYNGPEIATARNRVGRLRSQFTDDDIRLIGTDVAITMTNDAIVGLA